MKNYIYGHVSPETAYICNDYPWGFRLRTTIRYWIETSEKKNGGQRFCSQTINPKTGEWCAPKKSSYSALEVLYLDENEHVHCEAIRTYASLEEIEAFNARHSANFDAYQTDQIKWLLAQAKVMSKVTWTVTPSKHGPVSLFSQSHEDIEKRRLIAEEQAENERKKQDTFKRLNRAIIYEHSKL